MSVSAYAITLRRTRSFEQLKADTVTTMHKSRASFNPREAVESMLWAFRSRAAELFEPTRPNEYREYYKGVYGVLYARPAKAVRRLLAVDREILVLVTSFADLQQRLIQLAIDIIDNSDGRLERTVAVVVHRDTTGNAKLKNWGRELGLTVIPLFMAEYDLPSGQQLERLLLSEFYSHDPFDVTGPVSDDNRFYGRRDEAQDLARQLQLGQVRAVLGIRKIGKTSIIHRVLAVSQDFHDCYSVMIDCSKDPVWSLTAGQLLYAIAEAVASAVESDDYCAEVTAFDRTMTVAAAYPRLIERLRNVPGAVVLVFDEVDYITPGSPTASHWAADFNPFWRNLRAAYQEIARTDTRVSVLISGVSSKWFREESIEGVENAALAFIPEEYLSPLTPGASIAMIRSIGRTSGLLFDEGSANRIAVACSHIPFWIRKAGSYIHRSIDIDSRPIAVSEETVSQLVKAFIESEGAAIADVALSHLFRVYPELRAVARACSDGDSERQPRYLLAVLEKYAVIARAPERTQITGDMMKAGLALCLERQAPAASAIEPQALRPSKDDSPHFATVDEWADELSLIGSQRNKLEKRLRGLVVNFIRYDALQNKQRGTLADRILKVIDENRRTKWQHLTPDEVIERFNWSDLVRLIEREWSVLGGVFSDKAQFTLHCTVVNERFDAHAKDADRADVANYRRSLKWLEDALRRV